MPEPSGRDPGDLSHYGRDDDDRRIAEYSYAES
jgi:hypothetical protein